MRRFKGRLGVFVTSVEGVVTANTNNSDSYRVYNTELPDAFFAISRCIADSIMKYWGVDAKVLPLGTIEHLKKTERKQRIKSIVWAGNIKPNKRPQYLVECAKRFPKIDFVMIGDGDMLAGIRKQCEEEHIDNIAFTGRIPNEKVYEKMESCDLLLMTSEFEGLPKVIQEAAQCGLPSIYINENYTVDFITDGVNGYAVSDLDTMIERIQELLDDPQKYQQMSANAIETIRAYTWENLIRDYECYFIEQYDRKGHQHE